MAALQDLDCSAHELQTGNLLRQISVPNTLKVRAPIRREERQREKNHGHRRKDQDRLVALLIGDCKIVLLDRAELEELCGSRLVPIFFLPTGERLTGSIDLLVSKSRASTAAF